MNATALYRTACGPGLRAEILQLPGFLAPSGRVSQAAVVEAIFVYNTARCYRVSRSRTLSSMSNATLR